MSSEVADGYLFLFSLQTVCFNFPMRAQHANYHNHDIRIACSYALPVTFAVTHHFEVVEIVSTSQSETSRACKDLLLALSCHPHLGSMTYFGLHTWRRCQLKQDHHTQAKNLAMSAVLLPEQVSKSRIKGGQRVIARYSAALYAV